MRFFILLFTLILSGPLCSAAQHSTPTTLRGRVVDGETGEALAAAHVFLVGSTRGTTTNMEGWYTLTGLLPGAYEVAASMLGFEAETHRLTVADTSALTLDFRLSPTVLALGEVVVAADRPEQWYEHLAFFKDAFLGPSGNAAKCIIVNPEVLTLDYDADTDRLQATAHAPLVIENQALGYRVHFHLKEFAAIEGEVRYLGIPRFEEMEPRNKRETRRWARRRRAAYEGSMQHFLSTLRAHNEIREIKRAGFDVQATPYFDTDPTTMHPLRAAALLYPGQAPHSQMLSFEDHLYVVYKPDARLLTASGVPGMSHATPPLDEYGSWITLNNGPAEIDRFGHLFNPYAVTTYGLWSRERIADALPREYRPAR